MDKEDHRFVNKYFWIKGWGAKTIHQKLTITLSDDASGWFSIKIWLRTFRSGNFPCKDLPPPGRPPLTLGPQLEVFLQQCPFASAWAIAKHFLTTGPTVTEIAERKSWG
jgi:hypothetical protein